MNVYEALREGLVIPASPLALTAARRLDVRRQRALWRYYAAAGAGGVAIGVHTTQFAIREAGMYPSLLALAADEFARLDAGRQTPLARIAGLCGRTEQALTEAACALDNGFHVGLLSLAAFKDDPLAVMLDHCRRVAQVIPIMGFYLQTAVGGRVLPYAFWREFAAIENVVAIKVAPFNRYQTLEVVQAVADAGRDDIALYTGNDDAIISDLITPITCRTDNGVVTRHFVGGLLGHWAVWTQTAVALHRQCRDAVRAGVVPATLLARSAQVTDSNAAFFDAANGFKGCIAGLHEVLRRQGLFEGAWCLDPEEALSPGQANEIDRVYRAYPHLNDDAFVAQHLKEWMGTDCDAICVKPLPDYRIYVELQDGRKGIFDLSPYLDRGVLQELRDIHYFNRVDIVFGAVTWPHGQDIAPDTLAAEMNAEAIQSTIRDTTTATHVAE